MVILSKPTGYLPLVGYLPSLHSKTCIALKRIHTVVVSFPLCTTFIRYFADGLFGFKLSLMGTLSNDCIFRVFMTPCFCSIKLIQNLKVLPLVVGQLDLWSVHSLVLCAVFPPTLISGFLGHFARGHLGLNFLYWFSLVRDWYSLHLEDYCKKTIQINL